MLLGLNSSTFCSGFSWATMVGFEGMLGAVILQIRSFEPGFRRFWGFLVDSMM